MRFMEQKLDIKTIRKAICHNRGGHENADDEQIKLIWDVLPKEIQKQYLKSIETSADLPSAISSKSGAGVRKAQN